MERGWPLYLEVSGERLSLLPGRKERERLVLLPVSKWRDAVYMEVSRERLSFYLDVK